MALRCVLIFGSKYGASGARAFNSCNYRKSSCTTQRPFHQDKFIFLTFAFRLLTLFTSCLFVVLFFPFILALVYIRNAIHRCVNAFLIETTHIYTFFLSRSFFSTLMAVFLLQWCEKIVELVMRFVFVFVREMTNIWVHHVPMVFDIFRFVFLAICQLINQDIWEHRFICQTPSYFFSFFVNRIPIYSQLKTHLSRKNNGRNLKIRKIIKPNFLIEAIYFFGYFDARQRKWKRAGTTTTKLARGLNKST